MRINKIKIPTAIVIIGLLVFITVYKCLKCVGAI
jgi:hypothetical protein